MPRASVTFDDARFNRAVSAFLRRQAPKMVDTAVRRITFGVGDRIVRSLNGLDGTPKRIDTGRYRAGWGVGTTEATGRAVRAPGSSDPKNPSQPGDGTGATVRRGLSVVATVRNNVEYGEHVEYGTVYMTAGLHRAKALMAEGRKVASLVGGELAKSWRA